MAQNHVLLETIQLSQTASSVTFDNIPSSGYTDLKLVVSARCDYAAVVLGLVHRFNGDNVSGNYTGQRNYGSGAGNSYDTDGGMGFVNGTSSTANTFATTTAYIPNYRVSGKPKTLSAETVQESNATGNNAYMAYQASKWSGTDAINTIVLTSSAGNFVAGSTFSIYGVAATGVTPSTAPFADGGNIVANDGTYWYHAYLSSGYFIPKKDLVCDVMMVQGGGGGSNSGGIGSGGGGGGIFYSSANSLATDSSNVVIVGAGGARDNTSTGNGITGNLSQFNSNIISVINGAIGGATGTFPGGNSKKVISGTTTNYTGGTGAGDPNNATRSGGGGAGAGANGGNATLSDAGNGGAGLNTYSAWATATTTGVSGYYGGGGGGGFEVSGSHAQATGGAGGGGKGGAGTTAPYYDADNGVAGTGGGGGGCGGRAGVIGGLSGNGGSGIVIIRYTMV